MATKKKFSIETVFDVLDRATRPIKKIANQTKRFANITTKSFRRARIAVLKFNRAAGKKVMSGLKFAGKVAFAGLAVGAALATRAFVNFDQAITSAVAKFGGINIASEKGIKTFKALKEAARGVGATTEFTAAQAAGGLEFLALAGFNVEQSIASLPRIVDLATVANIDLARAVDIATDTLGAFNLKADDAIELEKNLARVSDVLAKTTISANTNMEDLFESISAGGADFAAGGQSIETFSSLIGILANASIKGGRAGTILKNVILRLGTEAGPGAKLLKKLGVRVEDANGDFKDMIDILADVEKATAKMGNVQRTAAFDVIFGKRAITGMNVLMGVGTKVIRIYRQSLIDAGGTAKLVADIMRQSILNKLKTLNSALIETAFVLLDAFSKNGVDAIDSMTAAVKNIDMEKFVRVLKADIIPLFQIWGSIIGVIFDGIKAVVGLLGEVGRGLNIIGNFLSFGALNRGIDSLISGQLKALERANIRPFTEQERDAQGIQTQSMAVKSGESLLESLRRERNQSQSREITENQLIIRDETGRAVLFGDDTSMISLAASGAR